MNGLEITMELLHFGIFSLVRQLLYFWRNYMQYQLKIQQLVTYAKSRVYRNFIRALSDNENIRLNGESNLFYFMTLCSYANFRTSTFCIDAMRYTLAPGEWMMPVRELMKIYRKKTEKGTVAVLERLQQSNHIHYELLHHRRYVKFRYICTDHNGVSGDAGTSDESGVKIDSRWVSIEAETSSPHYDSSGELRLWEAEWK